MTPPPSLRLRIAMEYAGTGLVLLPLLVGAFVAGPLVARAFESGTYRLGLTQSVTPAAWLRTKAVTATVTAVALPAAFRVLRTRHPQPRHT
ncbi:hypothetical protein AB0A05_31970 [Streptomyces sp. NPDC046374]|uniref:hypothetical protein n=1 Tax=unclassified Streptomyces TaxID=2593676 RepID=UPI0033D95337